ncbi:MAG: hypothetical protein RDV48_08545 [Candidatus Eremiobacteraeota bacterium]|nr:hypothetical protein [Candidatus Eremiobacteraeota bacterium]
MTCSGMSREDFVAALRRGELPGLALKAREGPAGDPCPFLVALFHPGTELTLKERIVLAASIVKEFAPQSEGRREDDAARSEAMNFLKSLIAHDDERRVFFHTLGTLGPELIMPLKALVISAITDSQYGQKLLLSWIAFWKEYWQAGKAPESAMEYVDGLMKAICYEDVEVQSLPLPFDSDTPRELLRRKLFSFIHNSDPKWNKVRPQKVLTLMGAHIPSPVESAKNGFSWRLYEISYCYSQGLDDRSELRRIAGDLLENADRANYESYAALFQGDDAAMAVDSAYAFIQATQFRTRKPKGPAEEYRKAAMASLERIFQREGIPPQVLARLLSILSALGLISPLLEFLERTRRSSQDELSQGALDALMLCWLNSLPKVSQEEALPAVLSSLVEAVTGGSDGLFGVIEARGALLAAHPLMRDRLRKALKALLADVDVGAHVRKRALLLLGFLGSEKGPEKKPSALLSGIEDDEEDEEPGGEPREGGGSEALQEQKGEPPPAEPEETELIPLPGTTVTVPAALKEFLSMRDKAGPLKARCDRMLRERNPVVLRTFSQVFEARESETGGLLYEHALAAGHSMIEFMKKEVARRPLRADEAAALEGAKDGLFFLFFYRDCPDLIKMEAFDALRNVHYFDILKADAIKRYALAFAKDAIAARSGSAATKALADLISLRAQAHAMMSMEGRKLDELLEDFTSMVVKEKDQEKRARCVNLLNHMSFQDEKILKPLAARIHPLHFREALAVLSSLVMRQNRWAPSFLLDAAGRDYMDIRNEAVSILATVGSLLAPHHKERSIDLILDHLDECYDDDTRALYTDAVVKIDAPLAAAALLEKCGSLGLTERKEYGSLLLKCFERMSAAAFMDFLEKEGSLENYRRFAAGSPPDSAMRSQAKRFLGLYRENFISARGRDAWEALQGDSRNPVREALRDISRLV